MVTFYHVVYNQSMIYAIPKNLKVQVIRIGLISLLAFVLTYFIDQYYILNKGWSFLLELVN